jgi:hypothetical protein
MVLPLVPLAGYGLSALGLAAFPGVSRELKKSREERERTGAARSFGGDVGSIFRGIKDPGAEGRSPFAQYLFGEGPRVADFTGVPVAGQPAGTTIPRGATVGGKTDINALIAALGAGAGGGGYTPVSVNRDLFRLAETPEEQALLAREMADIEARRSAGTSALTAGWGRVSSANAAAAEKARQQVVQFGDGAAAAWTDAAARATELAAQRASAAGAVQGRQSINVSPSGGAEDFIAFMQAQAPSARQFAERTQETLASDLDWMSGVASSQGEAYSADLQRQANVMAFERAREHNRGVQERINAERMALAQMEFSAASTNAQLAQSAAQRSGAERIQPALVTALLAGDEAGPGVLAFSLGISPEEASAAYRSAKNGFLGQSLAAQIAGFNR